MKRVVIILLMLTMLIGVCAYADSKVVVIDEFKDPIIYPIACEDLGGEAHWPSFRGLAWSMDAGVVLLIERERGVEFTERSPGMVYMADEVETLGYPARLFYYFAEDTGLYQVMASIALPGEQEADMALLKDLVDQLGAQYGEPEYDAWQSGAFDIDAALANDDTNILDANILVFGVDHIGERYQSGDEYLYGQVALRCHEDADGARFADVLMTGGRHVVS